MHSTGSPSGTSSGESASLPIDLDAVASLLARYGILLDQESDTQWSELFTLDARLEVIGGPIVEGRPALKDFAGKSPRGTHVTGVPHVEVVDSQHRRYSATSSWIFLNRGTGASVGGLYYDDLVPHGEGSLLFASRRIAMLNR
jgi:SnoaL-like domain